MPNFETIELEAEDRSKQVDQGIDKVEHESDEKAERKEPKLGPTHRRHSRQVIRITVHLCSKCGVQTIWTPDGPLHESDTTDHLADPGRIVTLEWDEESSTAEVVSDAGS